MFHCIGIIGFTIISGESTAQGFKNYFQRLRPCNDTEIQEYVHTVMNSCKESFSFVSAHALNSFALTFFIIFLLRKEYKWIPLVMILWATFHSYTRIYLGVHFPGDIVVGAIIGCIIGYIFTEIFILTERKIKYLNR